MANKTTFDSTKEELGEILKGIKDGKTQLPDFQRGWVWDDSHIKSLLSSIAVSYPIGAVMMLQTGNSEYQFKPRPIEGVAIANNVEPERLILDGQQRLTSLYQALFMNEPVSTKNDKGQQIKRWYYIDIDKAIDNSVDMEEAIISLPEDKIIRNFRGELIFDYSNIDKECDAGLLPLRVIFDVTELNNWQMKYLQNKPELMVERLNKWNILMKNVIHSFQHYQIPIIILRKDTPKDAVCQVFEKVNTGGVSLTVFELLTATFAADNFNLRDDWEERKTKLKGYKVLKSLMNTDFLQAVTLLTTYFNKKTNPESGVSCKRKDILKLTVKDYVMYADKVTKGFISTAKFLYTQKIYSSGDLPYKSQLVPLTSIFAILEDESEKDGIKEKIARWYWCGVLGELYGSSTETRFARDIIEVVDWVNGGEEPSTVREANFVEDRLYTLKTRNSAAYKGIYALLLRDGALDFRTGESVDSQTYFEENIDIHHIFPKRYIQKINGDLERCDCIINKTPISSKTNKIIGGRDPKTYLEKIQANCNINDDRMNQILKSHLIEPSLIKNNDFKSFFENRKNKIIKRIESAMGKSTIKTAF